MLSSGFLRSRFCSVVQTSEELNFKVLTFLNVEVYWAWLLFSTIMFSEGVVSCLHIVCIMFVEGCCRVLKMCEYASVLVARWKESQDCCWYTSGLDYFVVIETVLFVVEVINLWTIPSKFKQLLFLVPFVNFVDGLFEGKHLTCCSVAGRWELIHCVQLMFVLG